MKTITILGSTGSIGVQSLEIAKLHDIKVLAIAANSNIKLLAEQARCFNCKYVCVYKAELYSELKNLLSDMNIKIYTGMEGLCKIAELDNVDIMLNSVVGMVGLTPTLAAINHGTDIALANKETLVAGGELVINVAKQKGVKIYPVDSEHSAIFQCLQGNNTKQLKKIILTASGGPFFGKTKEDLKNVSLEDALNHPNWKMGNKITIDSATLMNKGLEFIEAMWLFNLKPEQIVIVVHRESVIHSAVMYNDNSVIAQLGVPDMKIPIQYALLYPDRYFCNSKELNLFDYGTLTFAEPDYNTFDCLTACIEAVKIGGLMPAFVNCVNEVAVSLFLNKKISFLKIGELVKQSIKDFDSCKELSLYSVLDTQKQAYEYVMNKIYI